MCSLANCGVRTELDTKQKKFRHMVLARNVLTKWPEENPKSLMKVAKTIIADDSNCAFEERLHSLGIQGELSKCMYVRCGRVWSVVVQSLPEEKMKFSFMLL